MKKETECPICKDWNDEMEDITCSNCGYKGGRGIINTTTNELESQNISDTTI